MIRTTLSSKLNRICHLRSLFHSVSQQSLDSKAFSKTLLLPQTKFPLWTEPTRSEAPFQARTCESLYRWQWDNAEGPIFVLHDGPPYANGDLHMGHALNKILKDIINRYHVLLGHRVHYIPGWDCHGLPIENKALQELGKDSVDVPASTIRQVAKATAIREIASQKEQFRQLGIMADWSTDSTYRTLDHKYEIRQMRIFQKMVERGLIYRHFRPVHYSPSSRSALAEAELVYKDDHISHSVYVTFNIDSKEDIKSPILHEIITSKPAAQLLVWTTTPWTLTANMGIAVHSELPYSVVRLLNSDVEKVFILAEARIDALVDIIGPVEILANINGSDLIGVSYIPIFATKSCQHKKLRIIHASHVTPDSGTGLVHCAPAHGAEDYNAFKALGTISSAQQDILCHVNADGKFTPEVAAIVGEEVASALVGREVLTTGSKAVVDILQKMGRLVKTKRIKHRYPYDWKTNTPIIVTATSQWFADLSHIKGDAIAALNDVTFYPSISRNRLESFVRSRSEWCISRQRVWGVPIPALYHVESDQAILDSHSLDHIMGVLEQKGVAYWWEGPVDDFVPPSLREAGVPVDKTWRKGTDTMDVWFDSGTSWSMLEQMGVGNQRDEGGRKFDADVCLEGSDQHRGWFQSQLLTAIGSKSSESGAQSPYGTLITHGMVLDQAGKKMSKSLGNIISPMTVVAGGKNKKVDPAYGADVLRLWAATVEYWRDMSVGPTVLGQAAEAMRKIRNSARFILGNLGDTEARSQMERVPRSEMGLAERYIMHELRTLERTALDGYSSYNFPKVINSLTNFTNITLSSLYFDITKDCLYADGLTSHERRAVATVLEHILTTMTTVLAPILPHLAEEIHSSFRNTDASVFTLKWQPLSPEWEDPRAAEDMAELLRIRTGVLSLLEQARRDKRIKSSLEAEVELLLSDDTPVDNPTLQLLNREENFLKTLFIVSDATLVDEGSLGTSAPEWLYSDTLSLPAHDLDVVLRVRPAVQEKCPRCWTFSRPESDVLCHRCSAVVG
ncbi:isoleucyl-tRNA synthetase [Infundibulicybe gibba]|nr:isoleucyl-tRNA synthetase [Infundibulicybe gibba]